MAIGTRSRFIIRYLSVFAPASLVWEFAHMPLYTLWQTGTVGEIAFAALHCTVGDVLIGTSALLLAVTLLGGSGWPHKRAAAVAVATIVFGLAYTVFSEWLNVELRQSWAYRDIMPALPPLGTGLTPVLQWTAIPALAYILARFNLAAGAASFGAE